MHNSLGFPQRSLVSQEDQSLVARPDVPRSTFINTWGHKTTFDAGRLVPFLVDEILPGDHVNYEVTPYVRMATPLFPLMSNQKVETFLFYCPNRLVWAKWKRMMGEQATPVESINLSVPVVTMPLGGFAIGSLFDHFGLPTIGQITAGQGIDVNALPARMYSLIYDTWFRDQNLINSIFAGDGDGPDAATSYFMMNRAKSHDYFTSALPWAQKFTPPTIPLGGLAPVTGIGWTTGATTAASGAVRETGPTDVPAGYAWYKGGGSVSIVMKGNPANPDSYPQIYANLAAATGTDINSFRQAFLVQQMLERDARGGTRYTEIILHHFGVHSPDARLQRPEYIGGGSSPLHITPIAQTAPGATGTVGALGGAGTASGQHSGSYAATEHGFVIGIINVRTQLEYQQGLHRMWSRRVRTDYYWPSLAGLGEQAILRKELYCNGVDADDETVFGYQERYQEYRTRTSEITGLFRSTTAGNIDEWHLGQQLAPAPVLGQTFIEDTPPMSRVLAAGTAANDQQYLADILIHRKITRAIPTYGVPATLGRF